jgi:DNA modification methylase
MIEVKNPNNLKTAHIDSFKPLQGELKDLSQENYNKLKNSILKHGFNIPVFVWNGYLLDGHQRQRVLLQEGWNVEVPYVEIEAETELEAKEILLKITSQYGKITMEGLDDFYPEWQELDINFDAISILDTEEPQEVIEDEVPEPPLEPKTVLGDLYEIGEHRLLCGDSTDSDQVGKLMNGEKADMVFTDPPYGISIVGNNGKVGGGNKAKNGVYSKVIADETTDTAKDFYNTCISLGMEKFIIWGGNYFVDFLPFSASWIIWDKRGDMNSNNFADGEMAWCSFETRVRIYKQLWNGMIRESEKDKRVHPTQKPIKVLSDIITDQIKGNLLYDGFLGSGSTMIAAHQLKRKCYGMELDPKYTDVCVLRMLKLDRNLKIIKNGVDETSMWLDILDNKK